MLDESVWIIGCGSQVHFLTKELVGLENRVWDPNLLVMDVLNKEEVWSLHDSWFYSFWLSFSYDQIVGTFINTQSLNFFTSKGSAMENITCKGMYSHLLHLHAFYSKWLSYLWRSFVPLSRSFFLLTPFSTMTAS